MGHPRLVVGIELGRWRVRFVYPARRLVAGIELVYLASADSRASLEIPMALLG